ERPEETRRQGRRHHRRGQRHRPGAVPRRSGPRRAGRAVRRRLRRAAGDRGPGQARHRPGGPHRQARRPRPRGVEGVRRLGRRGLRHRQRRDQQRRRRADRRRRTHELRAPRLRHGRQLLGCRPGHHGVPPPPHRLRRRSRRQHLEPVRADGGAWPVGVQRLEVRGPRLHRGAAPGDAPRASPRDGHRRPPGRHQDRDRPQRRSRRYRPAGSRPVLRQAPGQDDRREGCRGHPRRDARREAARARRRRRQGARQAGPGDRRGLPAGRGPGRRQDPQARGL
ncbi:MAG: Oxidoreductase, short-chain dehydrogenase/reductase family, partial [uncultured Nocardioidaceae bacterium]